MHLDEAFIDHCRQRIAGAIIPAMARLYDRDDPTWPDDFRPGLKWSEKVVSYYDYWACGISALAPLAARGHAQAMHLIRNVLRNCEYYRTSIYGQPLPDETGTWQLPLRRLLLHLALTLRTWDACSASPKRSRFGDCSNSRCPSPSNTPATFCRASATCT